MTKQEAIVIAGNYFPNYPSAKGFAVTSDSQVFHDKQHADNHANSFKKDEDRAVFEVSREEWEAYAKKAAKAKNNAAPAAPAATE